MFAEAFAVTEIRRSLFSLFPMGAEVYRRHLCFVLVQAGLVPIKKIKTILNVSIHGYSVYC